MNKAVNPWNLLILAASSIAILATSCATRTGPTSVGKKFREETAANLIIRYSSDQTIFMLKPDAHEGQFYRVFSRQELCDAASKVGPERDLAVVVIGYNRIPAMEQHIKTGWTQTLAKLNFRRVVFLRANNSDSVTKLRIVDEAQLSWVDENRHGAEFAGTRMPDRMTPFSKEP